MMIKIKCSERFKNSFVDELILREDCPFRYEGINCMTVNGKCDLCIEKNIKWDIYHDRSTPLEIECNNEFKDFFFSYMRKWDDCPFVWNEELDCDIEFNDNLNDSLSTEEEHILCNHCLKRNIKWIIKED